MMKRRVRPVDRAVATFLLLLMAVGSLALWIAIPAAVMRILMPISDSLTHQLVLALVGVPLAMVLFAAGLFWLNRLYLRVAGHRPDDDDPPRRLRGPLEPLLAWSFLLALLTLLIWYLFLPHGPPPPTVI
jgi:hypothetical protein